MLPALGTREGSEEGLSKSVQCAVGSGQQEGEKMEAKVKVQERMKTVERREQIIDQALEIIHDLGYPAFTTRLLAQKIGISEPALYRHFANKNEIVLGILDRMDKLGELVEKELENSKSTAERIEIFVRIHLGFFQNNPYIISILFADEFLKYDEVLANKLSKVVGFRHRLLQKIFETGRLGNEIVDISNETLATIIQGSIRVSVARWKASGYKYHLVDKNQELIQALVKIVTNKI